MAPESFDNNIDLDWPDRSDDWDLYALASLSDCSYEEIADEILTDARRAPGINSRIIIRKALVQMMDQMPTDQLKDLRRRYFNPLD